MTPADALADSIVKFQGENLGKVEILLQQEEVGENTAFSLILRKYENQAEKRWGVLLPTATENLHDVAALNLLTRLAIDFMEQAKQTL